MSSHVDINSRRLCSPDTVNTLKLVAAIVWVPFWVYWLAMAATAKESVSRGWSWGRMGRLSTVLAVLVTVRLLRHGSGTVHSDALGVIGLIAVLSGMALAIWARIHLGRNWGMPMSERAEPELVSSGPYRYVRHPIYTGLILALFGTALATNLWSLLIMLVPSAYFYYASGVEEQNLTATFPTQYPGYKAHTKRLIPFLL